MATKIFVITLGGVFTPNDFAAAIHCLKQKYQQEFANRQTSDQDAVRSIQQVAQLGMILAKPPKSDDEKALCQQLQSSLLETIGGDLLKNVGQDLAQINAMLATKDFKDLNTNFQLNKVDSEKYFKSLTEMINKTLNSQLSTEVVITAWKQRYTSKQLKDAWEKIKEIQTLNKNPIVWMSQTNPADLEQIFVEKPKDFSIDVIDSVATGKNKAQMMKVIAEKYRGKLTDTQSTVYFMAPTGNKNLFDALEKDFQEKSEKLEQASEILSFNIVGYTDKKQLNTLEKQVNSQEKIYNVDCDNKLLSKL